MPLKTLLIKPRVRRVPRTVGGNLVEAAAEIRIADPVKLAIPEVTMPIPILKIRPGVNTQFTATLLEAG